MAGGSIGNPSPSSVRPVLGYCPGSAHEVPGIGVSILIHSGFIYVELGSCRVSSSRLLYIHNGSDWHWNKKTCGLIVGSGSVGEGVDHAVRWLVHVPG